MNEGTVRKVVVLQGIGSKVETILESHPSITVAGVMNGAVEWVFLIGSYLDSDDIQDHIWNANDRELSMVSVEVSPIPDLLKFVQFYQVNVSDDSPEMMLVEAMSDTEEILGWILWEGETEDVNRKNHSKKYLKQVQSELNSIFDTEEI